MMAAMSAAASFSWREGAKAFTSSVSPAGPANTETR